MHRVRDICDSLLLEAGYSRLNIAGLPHIVHPHCPATACEPTDAATSTATDYADPAIAAATVACYATVLPDGVRRSWSKQRLRELLPLVQLWRFRHLRRSRVLGRHALQCKHRPGWLALLRLPRRPRPLPTQLADLLRAAELE